MGTTLGLPINTATIGVAAKILTHFFLNVKS